jgi:hypothetical protein
MMTAKDAKQTIRTKALSTYLISPRSTTSTTPNASDSAMAITALVPLDPFIRGIVDGTMRIFSVLDCESAARA